MSPSTLVSLAYSGDVKRIRTLLKARAQDVNQTDDGGQTALLVAAGKGFARLANLLLRRGADANLATTDNGRTPLWMASQEGHEENPRALQRNFKSG